MNKILSLKEFNIRFVEGLKEDLLQNSSWFVKRVTADNLEEEITDAGRVEILKRSFCVVLGSDWVDNFEFPIYFTVARWRDLELYEEGNRGDISLTKWGLNKLIREVDEVVKTGFTTAEQMADSYYIEIQDEMFGGYYTSDLLQYTPKEYEEISDLDSLDEFKYYDGIYNAVMEYIANRIFNIEGLYYHG
jgi:hypothetical protein